MKNLIKYSAVALLALTVGGVATAAHAATTFPIDATSGSATAQTTASFTFGSGALTLDTAPSFTVSNNLTMTNNDLPVTMSASNDLQITDLRGGAQGWTVSAAATAPISSGHTLTGVTLKTNLSLDAGLIPASTLAQSIPFDGTVTPVAAAKAGEANATTSYKFTSPVLDIPAGNLVNMTAGTYTSTITWTMANTPA